MHWCGTLVRKRAECRTRSTRRAARLKQSRSTKSHHHETPTETFRCTVRLRGPCQVRPASNAVLVCRLRDVVAAARRAGAVDGWFELHAKFGRLPMSELLQPAIRYAIDGFPVSPVVARDWSRMVETFHDKPGFADVYKPHGRAPQAGELFRNAALGRTLLTVADDRNAFYRGSIADEFVRFSESHGGFFAKSDFADHRSDWVEPISTSYRGGCHVWQVPPPDQVCFIYLNQF